MWRLLRRTGLSLLSVFFWLTAAAAPQDTPGVTDLIRDRQDRLLEEQQRRLEDLKDLPGKSAASGTPTTPVDSRCFPIKTIELTGADALSEGERAELIKPYIGQCLGVPQLNAVLKVITDRYLAKGLVTSRAYRAGVDGGRRHQPGQGTGVCPAGKPQGCAPGQPRRHTGRPAGAGAATVGRAGQQARQAQQRRRPATARAADRQQRRQPVQCRRSDPHQRRRTAQRGRRGGIRPGAHAGQRQPGQQRPGPAEKPGRRQPDHRATQQRPGRARDQRQQPRPYGHRPEQRRAHCQRRRIDREPGQPDPGQRQRAVQQQRVEPGPASGPVDQRRGDQRTAAGAEKPRQRG
ncbi:hemolysin secretion/activation protein, ShlB family [Pseudomonas poae RE*1-1-14]|nr:hemolysin secretion/activation protein, ShlB family [Pseudomonas poae RE*1-1-14]